MIFLRIAVFLTAAALGFGAHAQIAARTPATSAGIAGPSTITYIGDGGASSRSTCGSITPTVPAGNVGDLLIAVVAAHAQPTVTMNGWNPLFFDADPSNVSAGLFWRIATGGDPSTITQSGSCNSFIAQISRFRGVDTTSPFATAVTGTNESVQNANRVTSGTQAVAYGGAMVVFTTHTADNDDGMGAVAGFTQQFNSATTSGTDSSIALYTSSPATTPPYTAGPYQATKNRASDPNIGVVFALRPANSRLVISVPGGTTTGDVLVASIATTPSGTTVTPPTGWTLALTTPQATATSNRLTTLYHIVTGAEPASYTFDLDGTTHAGAAGGMIAFSGVDNVTPIDAQGGNTVASNTTQTATAITTTVPNAMVVGAFEFASAPSAANYNPGGSQGMTKALAQPSVTPASNTGVALLMSTGVQATAGSSGNKTGVASGVTADTGAAHLLSLRPGLAHYAISVSSTSVATCDYVDVTITGHSPSDAPVAPPAGRSLTLSLSPTTAVWQSPIVSGPGGWTPSGATATYLWSGAETAFTVRLRQYAAGTININLNDGSGVKESLLASEDPDITFVASSFRTSDAAGASLPIGTQIAGKDSNTGSGAQTTLSLQAINGSGAGACSTLFDATTKELTVEVGAQCNNPASCSRNVTLTTTASSGNTVSFTPDGTFSSTRTLTFKFNANSAAPFSLNYDDAGQITLQFRAQIPGSSPATYVQGTSNAFVVRPFGIAFPGIHHANTASGTTGALFPGVAAGDNFSMTLTAYEWVGAQDTDNDGLPDTGANITANRTTPNFSGTATVTAASNPAGAAGVVSRGATCATTPATIALAGGTATANDWCYNEVGNPLLTATVSNYLGSGQDVSGNSGWDGDTTNGPNVGRFAPKRFAVSNVSLATRSDLACSPTASSFTYMNETMQLAFRVTAQNAQNVATQNYAGAYAKVNPSAFADWGFAALNGTTDLTSRIDSSGTLTGAWASGVANVALTTAILRKSPDDPDGPYDSLKFGIAPVDTETPMDTLDMNVDGVGGNEHRDLGFTTSVRFGRLRLDNASGNEARRLAVPMRVEYWDTNGFKTNTADNCTSIPRSAIALDFTPPSNLIACETAVDSATLTFASGVAPLALAAPGTNNSGSVVLTVNLATAGGTYCPAVSAATAAATSVPMPYLLGRWNDAAGPTGDPDANASTNYDDKPSARAAFGLYGSQPGNFIYFRERY